MSAIYLLTVFFKLSNLYIIFIIHFLKTFTFHFKYSNVFICTIGSTFWFIINLSIYLLFFVVVSRIGRKSTTKCI
jgi:hypothetical protein